MGEGATAGELIAESRLVDGERSTWLSPARETFFHRGYVRRPIARSERGKLAKTPMTAPARKSVSAPAPSDPPVAGGR